MPTVRSRWLLAIPVIVGLFVTALLRPTHPMGAACCALTLLLLMGAIAWWQRLRERAWDATARGDVVALEQIALLPHK